LTAPYPPRVGPSFGARPNHEWLFWGRIPRFDHDRVNDRIRRFAEVDRVSR
jgi:hypothetical protein